jgi:hypothetical protein
VRRILDMYGIFQSQFRAEMPRPGFSEYFSSVRKYSMLLVMGASMFGMSAMLRQYHEITVPVTILLVAWGTYSVMVGTKQTRIELTETKLKRRASTCAPTSARSSPSCRSSGPHPEGIPDRPDQRRAGRARRGAQGDGRQEGCR